MDKLHQKLIKSITHSMTRIVPDRFKNKNTALTASSVLILSGIRIPFSFALNYMLSKFLGADGIGIYFLAVTIMNFFSIIATLGLPDSIMRFTASYAAVSDWSSVLGVYRQSRFITVVSSLFLIALLFLITPWMTNNIFHQPELTIPIYLMSFGMLLGAQTTIHSAALRGLHHIVKSIVVQNLILPLLTIIFIIALGNLITVNRVVMLNLVITAIGFLIVYLWWQGASADFKAEKATVHTRSLFVSAYSLFWIGIINFLINMSDTLMLGIISTETSVGIYGIARRNAQLIGIIIIAFNQIVAPQFAELYSKGDMDALRQLAAKVTMIMTLIALPLLLALMLFSEQFMGLFGATFTIGASTMVILALGQFFNVASGSVGYLLSMTGREHLLRNSIIVASITNMALNLLLIPKYDILGAAIATLISTVVLNTLAAIFVYRELSIITFPGLSRLMR